MLRACASISFQAAQRIARVPVIARKSLTPSSCAAAYGSMEYSTGAVAAEEDAAFNIIPYTKFDANMVSIIGNLGNQPELQKFSSGSQLCHLALAINKKEEPGSWVDVDVWGDYADHCVRNLVKGTRICVHGYLKVEKWTDKLTQQPRKKLNIVAREVMLVSSDYGTAGVQDQAYGAPAGSDQSHDNFQNANVEVYPAMVGSVPQDAPAQPTKPTWDTLYDHPEQFWDNRENKRKPNAPDFVHKDTKEAFWLNSSRVPAFIREDSRFTPKS